MREYERDDLHRELGYILDNIDPNSREESLVRTKIEEAQLWLTKVEVDNNYDSAW